MVVKKMKSMGKGKPLAWQIKDLVDYIRSPHNRNDARKIQGAFSRGFLSGSHSGQIGEMIAVAAEASHTANPVTHYMLSWRKGENPDRAQAEEAMDIFLEEMGLVGHQAVGSLHCDTDHLHLHVAVNRYNEELGKVVRPGNGWDIKQAHRAIAIIEQRQGWASEKNAKYAMANGVLVEQTTPKELKPSQKALDLEHRTGMASAERIAQEKVVPVLKGISSWPALHAKFDELGLRYEKKGSGAIIMVGDVAVKASNVHRSLSMAKLMKKWGDFVPGEYKTEPAPLPPRPVSNLNIKEWEEYQSEMAQIDTKTINHAAKAKFEQGKKELAAQMKKKYERCDHLGKKHGPELRRIGRFCVKEEFRGKRAALFRAYQKEKRRPHVKISFPEWLKKKGYTKQADLWQQRLQIDTPPAQSRHSLLPQPGTITPQLDMFLRYANAIRAQRFRVTAIKQNSENGTKRAFVVDKKNGESKGFAFDEMTSRMDFFNSLDKRGENIYYTPLSDDYHHILVDDVSPEAYQQFTQDGFQPAVVIESSPNNYQCILVFPKQGSPFDREIGNMLSKALNQKYGDPKLSGAIHPHRAPGFTNRKPMHQKEDGSFPVVKMPVAEQRLCSQSQAIAVRVLQQMEAFAQARKEQQRQRCLAARVQPGNATNAYYAHFHNIKDHFTGENIDLSRVDAMIALRMRATGHDLDSIRQTIELCAPTIRDGKAKHRYWPDYASRTANYAFSAEGDLDLARHDGLRKTWKDIEIHAEPLPTAVPKPGAHEEKEQGYVPVYRPRMR